MTLFLTSHMGGYQKTKSGRIPAHLNSANGFITELKKRWPHQADILFVAADPDTTERNDGICGSLRQAFPLSGLPVRRFDLCDGRDREVIKDISSYSVVILSGGHVPTQNSFFTALGLKELIANHPGIVIGISAGTMNCAQTVYAHPELIGEAVDPHYNRFIPGLGLTKYMILPHYQAIKDDVLDGLRVFEDIAFPDSFGKSFYALNDGSFILEESGIATLHGEARRITDGTIELICKNNQTRLLF